MYLCTSGETCQKMGNNLVCIGIPVDLDDGNLCTNDWCDPVQGPKHDPIPDCQAPCEPGETMTGGCGNCGTQSRTCSGSCQWGGWSACVDPCQCDCVGGTCCSNGCDYDTFGTPCQSNACKQCNGDGSCVNKSNGVACAGGECNNGQCVECLSGETRNCDPNCGVFSDPDDGEQECSGNEWGECKPVWCGGGPWPVYYPIAPMDHNWHCQLHQEYNIYLCVQVVLSWICADCLEFRLMKSHNVYGADETGPWDNDIKVVLRNTDNGKTYSQNQVSCAGNTDSQGGCKFDVGNSTLTNTLSISGTDSLEVDIYSPYTSGILTGKTGKVQIMECY